jgi:deoxyribodipyrimidine photolyase
VEFIRDSLVDLDHQLQALGLSHGIDGVRLMVRHGRARQVVAELARTLGVQAVLPTTTTSRTRWPAMRPCAVRWPARTCPSTPARTMWSSSGTR